MERFINGSAATTLAATINSTQTTITVADSTDFSPSTPGNFRIRIGDEIMIVTNISHPTWTVVRGTEGTLASVQSSGVPVNYTMTAGALDQFRKDGYGYGAYASKPSVAQAGMRYFCNDAPYILQHDGSSWKHFGPIWRMKRPIESENTWMNQGTSTFTNQTFIPQITSTLSIRGLHQALPGSSYKVEGMWSLMESRTGSLPFSQYWGAGVYVRESSSGKVITWGMINRDTGGLQGDVIKWTNPTTFSASYFSLVSQLFYCIDVPPKIFFWRIRCDGTNRYYEWSWNGDRWIIFWQTTATDYLTADQGGIYVLQGHATLAPYPTFLHFRVW